MKERALFAAPIFVAIALHAWAAGAYAQDAFVATFALAAIPLGGRLRLGAVGLRALALLFFGVGAAIGWAHTPELGFGPGTLPRSASLIASGALLAAASRLFVRAEWTRERASFVLGMLGVAASGATRLGPAYAVFAAAYLVSALVALRWRDAARAHPAHLRPRQHAALAGVIAVTTVVAAAFAAATPRIHDAVQRAFDRAFVARDVVGFGAGAWLGSMRDMMKSDEEVLRVEPPPHAAPIDYLRGAVYDEYRSDGFWATSLPAERVRELAVPPDQRLPATVTVRRIAGDATRYFLPLRARSLSVASGSVVIDGLGGAHTASNHRVGEYRFVIGDRDDLAPLPPTASDVQVPPTERAALAQLAREWTGESATPDAALEAIRRHLRRDYTYSLSFVRDADDPLLDFLFKQKLGYCTYFASAMVMLARVSGVPARLVAGYRVAEWNPVTSEWIVREKNAHAWVEAWVGGAWRTFDPTPMTELPQDEPHVAALGTLAADAVGKFEQAITYTVSHVTPAQLLAALVVLGSLWLAVRKLRARARRTVAAHADAGVGRPLPCFARLIAALEKNRGLVRPPSEPLETFARRLADAGLPEAAALVERYAALRYGGQGDGVDLDRDVDRFLRTATKGAT